MLCVYMAMRRCRLGSQRVRCVTAVLPLCPRRSPAAVAGPRRGTRGASCAAPGSPCVLRRRAAGPREPEAHARGATVRSTGTTTRGDALLLPPGGGVPRPGGTLAGGLGLPSTPERDRRRAGVAPCARTSLAHGRRAGDGDGRHA